MSVVNLRLMLDINMCCILPDELQIANEGWFLSSKYQYKRYPLNALTYCD